MNCPFKASVGEDAQTHLSSKDPTNADDAEDIKDGRADDRSDSNITVSDEDTWKQTQWAKVLHEKSGNNDCVTVPITEAKSSGAELPAAMNVAPATSSLRFSFCTTQQQQTIHIQQSLWHKHLPNLEHDMFYELLKASKWVRGRIVQTLLLSLYRGITQINCQFTSEQSYLTDFLKRHHEVVVAHDRQGQEHVEGL